ncbi:unnamed protein product [Boreogadus saida]
MFPELNAILNTSPDNFKQRAAKFVFLGLAQSFSHYSAVSQRLGVSLTQAKEKGQLLFLEVLNESLDVLLQKTSNTESQALDFLRDPAVGTACLGVSVGSVLDFSHYCFVTVCSQLKGNMVYAGPL